VSTKAAMAAPSCFHPHLPPPTLGVLHPRPQSTDASVHCQRMTIAVLVLEGYSHML
jgi:hypothetical protein